MLEKSVYRFIFFGTALRYLQDVDGNYRIKSTTKGMYVLGNIEDFLRQLEELQLKVTWRAAYQLREIRDELKQIEGEDARLGEKSEEIREVMKTIRPTLEAEARGMIAYVVSERRYRTDHLIEEPSKLFATGAYDELPAIAQSDFAEAARCLAFERPTAAAFHMLRATEAMLREYYCSKVKRKRAALMWGAIISAMRSKPAKFPKVIVGQLDHIREAFRNPTAHPEKVYDIDEAQDLFAICIDAANRMVADVR
jgi:hypothetical protein